MPVTRYPIVIDAKALVHTYRSVSTERDRLSITGILCQRDGTLVATNGRVMTVWPNAVTGELLINPITLDIDKSALTQAKKKGVTRVEILLATDTEPSQISFYNGEFLITAFFNVVRVIDLPFPNWSALIPKETEFTPDAPLPPFNPEMLDIVTIQSKEFPSSVLLTRCGTTMLYVSNVHFPTVMSILMGQNIPKTLSILEGEALRKIPHWYA